ncbi:MAG: hypothetical protein V4490_01970 [Pseudomonadota bacterium]
MIMHAFEASQNNPIQRERMSIEQRMRETNDAILNLVRVHCLERRTSISSDALDILLKGEKKLLHACLNYFFIQQAAALSPQELSKILLTPIKPDAGETWLSKLLNAYVASNETEHQKPIQECISKIKTFMISAQPNKSKIFHDTATAIFSLYPNQELISTQLRAIRAFQTHTNQTFTSSEAAVNEEFSERMRGEQTPMLQKGQDRKSSLDYSIESTDAALKTDVTSEKTLSDSPDTEEEQDEKQKQKKEYTFVNQPTYTTFGKEWVRRFKENPLKLFLPYAHQEIRNLFSKGYFKRNDKIATAVLAIAGIIASIIAFPLNMIFLPIMLPIFWRQEETIYPEGLKKNDDTAIQQRMEERKTKYSIWASLHHLEILDINDINVEPEILYCVVRTPIPSEAIIPWNMKLNIPDNIAPRNWLEEKYGVHSFSEKKFVSPREQYFYRTKEDAMADRNRITYELDFDKSCENSETEFPFAALPTSFRPKGKVIDATTIGIKHLSGSTINEINFLGFRKGTLKQEGDWVFCRRHLRPLFSGFGDAKPSEIMADWHKLLDEERAKAAAKVQPPEETEAQTSEKTTQQSPTPRP